MFRKCAATHRVLVSTLLLCWGTVDSSVGQVIKAAAALSHKSCPQDYMRRVETCIMEAQVAPQAGGGLALVIRNDTIVDLCDRGLLRKTIDCLEEIHSRCSTNTTVLLELDRLYSVENWVEGERVLCDNTQLFLDNYDCLSKRGTSVMTCVLLSTHIFRMGLSFTDPDDHAGVREVTCNFAESIVKCVRGPLVGICPSDIVKSVGGAMHLFLPPFCLTDSYITVTQHPLPPVTDHPTDFNVTDDPTDFNVTQP